MKCAVILHFYSCLQPDASESSVESLPDFSSLPNVTRVSEDHDVLAITLPTAMQTVPSALPTETGNDVLNTSTPDCTIEQ